jgi:hypothetical protein
LAAAGRVDRHETAFSYRDAKWSMVKVGIDPDPANAAKITAWTKDYWAAVHPYSLGAYVKLHEDERSIKSKRPTETTTIDWWR